MIAYAFLLALSVFLLFCFYVMNSLPFLSSYRSAILSLYGIYVFSYAVMLFVNLLAGGLVVFRSLGLRRAGRRLEHLDRQEGIFSDHLSRYDSSVTSQPR